MSCKKMYIALTLFLAISGSILTWMLLYGNLPHNSPIRAKQVFNSGVKEDSMLLSSSFFRQYNPTNNVQTIVEAISFN